MLIVYLQNLVNGLDYGYELGLGVSFYLLGYDGNGKLTQVNNATKENLKTYLDQYRILTDAITIKDAYIINIGLEFDIISRPNQNGNQVILRCIQKLKDYFDTKKWQINQPIVISNLYTELDKIEGVQTVKNVEIVNKTGAGLGYSEYAYDTKGATINNVVYPSIDPMIFEVKYPDSDIQGRVVSL